MADFRQRAASIGGVPLEVLADRFGTPLYVYDAATILHHARTIRQILSYRPLRILYSAKANPALAIAALLREEGIGLDACSPGDLVLADRVGFTPAEISYTGFGATKEELRGAACRCGTVVVDSLAEIAWASAVDGLDSIGLRVNPSIAAGFHGHVMAGTAEAKFGLHPAEVPEALSVAGRLGLEVQGLHSHLGSDLLSPEPHIALLSLLAGLAVQSPGMRWINLGGGFGTPRRSGDPEYDWSAFNAAATRILRALPGPAIELRIEPGGHLLMEAGVLLARVIEIRPPSGGRLTTAVVDASTNHLVSVLLYGAHHPARLASPARAAGTTPQRIAGQLMQAGDVLVDRAELPPLEPGDLLTLGHAGAYAASRASVFNARPRPAEVLVRDGEAHRIRRAETEADLFARDVMP